MSSAKAPDPAKGSPARTAAPAPGPAKAAAAPSKGAAAQAATAAAARAAPKAAPAAAAAAAGSPRSTPPPPTPNLGQLVRPSVRLVVWGRNDMGQLALPPPAGGGEVTGGFGGMAGSVTSPTQILAGKDVVCVAGGAFHSAWVTGDGELYTSGCNDAGQLGRSAAAATAASPRQQHPPGDARAGRVTALESYSVVAAGCGAAHTMALTDQGSVFAWGSNEFGQLGVGAEGADQHHPRPVKGAAGERVVRLAVGSNHALLLTAGGGVLAVGQGSFGALGLGPGVLDNRSAPVPLPLLLPLAVVQVSAGDNHSAALSRDGRVLTWGRGKYGQLGHGDWDNRPSPVQVAALRGVAAAQVACGGDHTLVIGSRGAVLAFGRGLWGATGLGATDNTCRPSRVQGLESEHVVQVAAGSRHSLALTASHAVYAFGNNDFGQLGLPRGPPPSSRPSSAAPNAGGDVHPSPRRVASLPALPVLAVAAGGDCSMALLQEARPGALAAPAGPSPGRRYGLPAAPYAPPDLLQLITAASTASEDPRALRDVVAAVEDVFSSPGFLLSAFAAAPTAASAASAASWARPTGASPSGAAAAAGGAAGAGTPGGAAAGASPQRQHGQGQQARAQAQAEARPADLDVDAIQACFEALLRLYKPEVVAAVGGALLRLLDTMEAVMARFETATATATAAAGPGAAASAGSPLHTPVTPLSSSGGGGSAAAAAAAPAAWPFPDLQPVSVLLRVLFIGYQCPLLAGSAAGLGVGATLASRLVHRTVRLEPQHQQTLSTWLAALPPEVFGGRVVRPLQAHLGHLAAQAAARAAEAAEAAAAAAAGGGGCGGGSGGGGAGAAAAAVAAAARGAEAAARSEVLGTALVVAALAAGNERLGCPIPYTEFHNAQLSSAANLRDEYVAWLQAGGERATPPAADPSRPWRPPRPLVSLCQLPSLLTPDAKSRILQGEARLQMEAEMSHSAREALLQGLHPASALFLDIAVRRGPHLLPDAAAQLAARPPHQLKRPLRVSFVSNGVPEEGVDQGGVSREFFQLLVAEIFQPAYGMFTYSEETRAFYFSPAAAELEDSSAEFRLVGQLLGLAIYNGVILDVHFPPVVYKKLLNEPVGLPDLADAFPALGRSLQAVLAMDPSQVQDVLCRNFEAEYEVYGERRTVPLAPGGAATPVTGANVRAYVARLTEWTLNESVDKQFRAFGTGFHQVCGGPALGLFRHEELELLVCGLPHLDFAALEAHARYDGGYSKDHPTVRMLWQVVSEFNTDQRRRFLAFTTGCDRAPVAGLGALVLVVQRAGPDSERLPSAHTCFNTLLLPDYATRAKLKAKLLTAIENAQGFGLK